MMGGCDAKLGEWIAAVAPKAIAYAHSLIGSSADAEDMVHDVLVRLLRHAEYDLFKDGEKLLYRSITNAAINHKTRRRELASLDAEVGDGGTLGAMLASKRHACPHSEATANELAEAIEHGLAELPPMQRAAIELKSFGQPLEQIGEILGVSPNHAGVLVHRGRNALRGKLSPFLKE